MIVFFRKIFHSLSYFVVGLLGSILLQNCVPAALTKPPTVILANSFPMVRVEYEYDKFFLTAPFNIIDGHPTALKAGIFIIDSLSKPILTRTFLPDEKIEFMLPRNLLLDSPGKSVFKLEILGDDYDKFELEIQIPEEGNVQLDQLNIKLREIVIAGEVLTRSKNNPVINANVLLVDSLKTIVEAYTDFDGNFTFILPGTWIDQPAFQLIINTDGYYPEKKKTVFIERKKAHFINIKMGATEALLNSGAAYRVTQNLVPFRTGPENGASIKYLLNEGEPFSVSKTAGDRVFGFVETINEEKNYRYQEEGWILLKYLEIIQ